MDANGQRGQDGDLKSPRKSHQATSEVYYDHTQQRHLFLYISTATNQGSDCVLMDDLLLFSARIWSSGRTHERFGRRSHDARAHCLSCRWRRANLDRTWSADEFLPPRDQLFRLLCDPALRAFPQLVYTLPHACRLMRVSE